MKLFEECLVEAEVEVSKKYDPRPRKKRTSKFWLYAFYTAILILLVLDILVFVVKFPKKVAPVAAQVHPSVSALDKATYTPYVEPKVEFEKKVMPELEPEEYKLYATDEFKVTHYCGCSKCCGKWSSGSESEATGCRGDKLTPYVSVAADPRVLPYGTVLWDEDGNEYIVQDVGGAIKGNRIDLFVGSHSEALKLGVKHMNFYWEVQDEGN